MVGPTGPTLQRKHVGWVRDRDADFVDDAIDEAIGGGLDEEDVDVIVQLNRPVTARKAEMLFSPYGEIERIGESVPVVFLRAVPRSRLQDLALMPEVAMVEWHAPVHLASAVSTRTVQACASTAYSPHTADDVGVTGAGVRIAIVDSGVDDGRAVFGGRFRLGFDATRFEDMDSNGTDDSCQGRRASCADPDDEPADGNTNPTAAGTHGTVVAAIALGAATAGAPCSIGPGVSATCRGVAPGAELVDVKVCGAQGCTQRDLQEALDWLIKNAARLNVRVANLSLSMCQDDDGTSSLALLVDRLAAQGVVVVAAHGNAATLVPISCTYGSGTRMTSAPGSASAAITVGACNDGDTLERTDDVSSRLSFVGPRSDFERTRDALALKPDLVAPGERVVAPGETTDATGTSLAAPHVAGAAALLLEARAELDTTRLKELLVATADRSLAQGAFASLSGVDPPWSPPFGAGVLNVGQAVESARDPAQRVEVGFPSCVGTAPAGQPCTLASPSRPWENSTDIRLATPPVRRVPNTVTAQVRNRSTSPTPVLVTFAIAQSGGDSPGDFTSLGAVRIVVPAATTVSASRPWEPRERGAATLRVTLSCGLDGDATDDVTALTVTVASSASAATSGA